jgi:glycosyltransferase involved in cell wall biosynthesis
MFFQDQAKIVQNNSTSWIGLPGLENEPPYFLASARFIRRKNILGLLEAYHQYTKQVVFKGSKPWRLIVLGDGEDKPEITNLIKNLSLDGVTLAGIQPYEILPVYYGYASAFIHPALQDQWGLVVNEAMATGLPVLVSKQSGCAEDLVLDGVNGFQFDARNPTELAELMVKFSQGEFDCQQMGKESQRIISQWGLDRFANGLLAAVEAVL